MALAAANNHCAGATIRDDYMGLQMQERKRFERRTFVYCVY